MIITNTTIIILIIAIIITAIIVLVFSLNVSHRSRIRSSRWSSGKPIDEQTVNEMDVHKPNSNLLLFQLQIRFYLKKMISSVLYRHCVWSALGVHFISFHSFPPRVLMLKPSQQPEFLFIFN